MKNWFTTATGLLVKSAKIIKSLKVLKAGLSVVSMALFGFCETWVLGAALAFSLVFLLFLHEMGHALALRAKGFGLKLPLFIPFVGAIIFAPRFTDRQTEAYVGLAGPLLGTLSALLFAVPYLFSPHRIWLAGSLLGVGLNLFNMLPVSPFDGGRVLQAVDQRLRYLGYALLMSFTVWLGEPGMLILWILVIGDLDWSSGRRARYAQVVWVAMVALTLAHVGQSYWANIADCVLAFLFVGLHTTASWYECRSTLRRINAMSREEVLAAVAEAKAQQAAQGDQREMPDLRSRRLWLLLWLSLLLVQALIMLAEARLMK